MDALFHLLADRSAWHWMLTSALRVLLILTLAWLALRGLRLGLRRFEERLLANTAPDAIEDAKRTRTLTEMLRNVLTVAVLTVTALTVLQELHVNIMPILTGAGILGLAVGFGAQTLVKDIISGFFLIVENQVRVGDVAQINGTGGLVEAINLRTIVLRDQHGAVHIIPCGSVTTLTNLSKDFAFAVLDIGVAYKHDTDEVVAVLEATAASLRADPRFGPLTIDPLEVVGVEAFGDSSVTLRVRIKTQPLKQWTIAREFRRRIKKAFDQAGIEIPFPQRDLTVRYLPPPPQ